MTEREALKQLLEALDKELPHNMKHIAAGQRFNARTALAHPEQEPVAKYTGETWCGSVVSLYEDIPLDTLLYTTPPQRTWIGLTDEEVEEIFQLRKGVYPTIRATEAKLKEKNT